MPPSSDFYPPSPPSAGGLSMPPGYRLRVVAVLLSLLVFVALYLGLMAASVYGLHASFTGAIETDRDQLIVAVVSGLMLLFLSKGLLKRRPFDTSEYLEITAEEQPRLFAFVRRLCAEAKAPLPGRIFLTPDVNAAVIYPQSILTLFLPTRKNLVIGLGLVNVLTLDEFKAVLAHEFGHFSQSSMRLGQYVYVANRAVADLVFQRDWFDRFLTAASETNTLFVILIWFFQAIVWVLRKLLVGLYLVTNLLNLALSRQMEFNADAHAVRLAGSDAVVASLWHAERGSLSWQVALADLASGRDHRLYTDDVFGQHDLAAKTVRERISELGEEDNPYWHLLEDYAPGPALRFPEGDQQAAGMWATHPPNRQREQHAKDPYVAAARDERSAWSLFSDVTALRRNLTIKTYEVTFGLDVSQRELMSSANLDARLAEERAEMKQPSHYHGCYDDRLLKPGDIEQVMEDIDAGSAVVAADRDDSAVVILSGTELETHMKQLEERRDELAVVVAASRFPEARGQLSFRGTATASMSDDELEAQVSELSEAVVALHNRLEAHDRALFRRDYREASPEQRSELATRYRFLVAIQEQLESLGEVEGEFEEVIDELQTRPSLSQEEQEDVQRVAHLAQMRLAKAREACTTIVMPAMTHVETGASVADFVVRSDEEGRPVDRFYELTAAYLQRLATQYFGTLSRLRRLHFKNLGLILQLHEAIASRDAETGQAEAR